MSRLAVSVLLAVAFAAGCAPTRSPELRVLGVHDEPRHEVVFVQVTNPASRAMRLTKLEYTFAAAGGVVSAGAVELSREVPAGEAVVVEVPFDATSPPTEQLTLRGKLTAELDQIIRIFRVSAKIAPK